MLTSTDSIAVRDPHTGELLPFSVPADFFDGYTIEEAAEELNIVPAPDVNARTSERAEELHNYTTVWTPDDCKWDFVQDVWISDTFDMLTTWELLRRYDTFKTTPEDTTRAHAILFGNEEPPC